MTGRRWKDGLLLAAVVAGVYANSLAGGFHYDDFHSLVWNPHIRQLGNIPAFFTDPSMFSVDPDKAMFRPLLLTSYALNYAVGGYEGTGYHLVNALIHLACALLVWLLAAPGGRGAALCAGLIFALHPLASEPVNYVSSRSESLAVALALVALYCYRRQDQVGAVAGPVGFAAALMVKSMAIVLPGLLLLDAHCRGQRLLARRLWPYGLVAAAYVATIVANRFLGDSLAKAPRGLASQLLTQCKAAAYYLKLVVMPVGLNVEPQFAAADALNGTVAASLALILSLVYMATRSRVGLFGLGWAGMALAPTFIVPLNVLVNEHRLYLPLAGLALVAGLGWERAGRKWMVPGAIGLILWAGISIQRNNQWRDEISLWSAAAARGPQMPRVHVHLGNAQRERGRYAEAKAAYERALALDPRNRPARTNLANLLYEAAAADSARRHAHLQEAISHYEQVLQQDPSYREAANNLGSVLMLLEQYDQAAAIWAQSIRRHPHHPEAHFNMGLLQTRLGRPAEAIGFLRQALALGEDGEIRRALGHAQVAADRLKDAARTYRRAAELDPADAVSRYNLAEVLLVAGQRDIDQGAGEAGVGQWREARGHLQILLRQHPDHQRARQRLAQLEERLR